MSRFQLLQVHVVPLLLKWNGMDNLLKIEGTFHGMRNILG